MTHFDLQSICKLHDPESGAWHAFLAVAWDLCCRSFFPFSFQVFQTELGRSRRGENRWLAAYRWHVNLQVLGVFWCLSEENYL